MLDPKIIEELKEKLIEEKTRLENDLSKLARKEGDDYQTEFEEIGRSEEDNADEMEQYMDDLGVTESLEKRLKEVNLALESIESGSYGKCEGCGGEIPVERLKVYPAATKCTGCLSAKA